MSLSIIVYNNLTKPLKWNNYEPGVEIADGRALVDNIAPSDSGRVEFIQTEKLHGISGTISYKVDEGKSLVDCATCFTKKVHK